MSEATWEPKLQRWSVGPGKTEAEKMNHAVAGIAGAIKSYPKFVSADTDIIATGSYANRTHIPVESDVDVAVIYKSIFGSDWSLVDSRAGSDPEARGALLREAGLKSASYSDDDYRNDVEAALVARFKPEAVDRGPICFDVHENTYRVESDCVAAFEHRLWFRKRETRELSHATGIRVTNDAGRIIINYPTYQLMNGREKHDRTHKRFKKLVRIVKNLAVEMEDAGIAAAKPMVSFLLESLVYQVPDGLFTQATFYDTLQAVLAHLVVHTKERADCEDWKEENEIKPLFGDEQKWTQEEVHTFGLTAWSYVGF